MKAPPAAREVVGEGLHEDIDISNSSRYSSMVVLEIELAADFADVVETKSGRQPRVRSDVPGGRMPLTALFSSSRTTLNVNTTSRTNEATPRPIEAPKLLSNTPLRLHRCSRIDVGSTSPCHRAEAPQRSRALFGIGRLLGTSLSSRRARAPGGVTASLVSHSRIISSNARRSVRSSSMRRSIWSTNARA
jgi:hypothetical protein